MKYPTLNELPTTREMISAFRGYNHNLRIGNEEFYDMTNLSSSDYPVLSPRKKRGIYATPSNPQGLIAKDALCYVDGSDFVINGYHVKMGLSTATDMCPKSLVSMGTHVIIMPDKMYVNTTAKDGENDFEFGKIEVSATPPIDGGAECSFFLCDKDGNKISPLAEKPGNYDDGDRYMEYDDDGNPVAVYQYYSQNAMWSPIDTYVGIGALPNKLEVGDSVIFSGLTLKGLKELNGQPVIIEGGQKWNSVTTFFWFKGICDIGLQRPETPYTVERKMPNMDFIIESQNRLWGCRYGVANNGEIVNEIYATKLGDFKNWQSFAGVSTDSYAASVGTDGPFTGAINYLGYPVFFKDNCIHRVYGSYPAQYQIQTTMCRGVQKGCEKSLAIVNETLYYKSRHAICSYDGSLPQEISSALGDTVYHSAVGGALGNKYYVSMADQNDERHIFVCDIRLRLWYTESPLGDSSQGGQGQAS